MHRRLCTFHLSLLGTRNRTGGTLGAWLARTRVPLFLIGVIGMIPLIAAGCEGIDRKHDPRVVDVTPPAVDAPQTRAHRVNVADQVENMMAARQAYLSSIMDLEKVFLVGGDSNRADWARRQRDLTKNVLVYPYLTDAPPERSEEVAAEQSAPEADALYNKALARLNEFGNIPLAGALAYNKKKAREALDMFKQVLERYPKSDKVDDCAFYCGEIYKEYLREDDPDDELAVRYYKWAVQLNPKTPHAARFQLAVVYDFRRHNRDAALELYHQVLDLEENHNQSNVRFSATRIEQLSDEDFSHLRPQHPRARPAPPEPKPDKSGVADDGASTPVSVKQTKGENKPLEPDTAP